MEKYRCQRVFELIFNLYYVQLYYKNYHYKEKKKKIRETFLLKQIKKKNKKFEIQIWKNSSIYRCHYQSIIIIAYNHQVNGLKIILYTQNFRAFVGHVNILLL